MKFVRSAFNPYDWHRWFAWHPVWTEDKKHAVWLEHVERRRMSGWHAKDWYVYRAIPNEAQRGGYG